MSRQITALVEHTACNLVGLFGVRSEPAAQVLIVEQHDEWAVAERRYLSETSMARLRQTDPAQAAPSPRTRRRLAG